MYAYGLRIAVTDIVYDQGDRAHPIKVTACGQAENQLFILGETLEVLETELCSQVVRKKTASSKIVWVSSTHSVTVAKCWKPLPDGRYCVVRALPGDLIY